MNQLNQMLYMNQHNQVVYIIQHNQTVKSAPLNCSNVVVVGM